MKVMNYTKYGAAQVLTPAERPTPRPGKQQALVRVHATSVNPIDWKLRSGSIRFVMPQRFPVTPGFDVAGVIEALGEDMGAFHVGQRVYARLNSPGGASATHALADAAVLAAMPDGLSFTDGAAIPLAGLTAWQALVTQGGLQAGQRVLVIGASGGVGHFGVQIAKAKGAFVAGVCSGRNAALVRDLGADVVHDYTTAPDLSEHGPYDLVLDCIGTYDVAQLEAAMRDGGARLCPNLNPRELLRWALPRRVRTLPVLLKARAVDLDALSALVERGALRVHIDSTFPLEQLAQAHERSESGRVTGKVVVTVD